MLLAYNVLKIGPDHLYLNNFCDIAYDNSPDDLGRFNAYETKHYAQVKRLMQQMCYK